MSEVADIFIDIVCHFLKWANKLVVEHVWLNELSLGVDDLGDAELYIWDLILGSLQEDWDDLVGDLILHDEWHDSRKGLETAHSVVVALLVNVVVVVNDWDVLGHDPVLLELLSKDGTLGDAHLSHTGGSVGQVSHEDALQMFAVNFFAEDDGKVGDQFKHSHSNSPLTILGHVG